MATIPYQVDEHGRIKYFYRGPIERGKDYTWKDGYSPNTIEGNIIYPWSTKQECRKEAKDCFNCKAVFID